MSSIFGDTDDISFGSSEPTRSREKTLPEKSGYSPRPMVSRPPIKREAFEPTHIDDSLSALSRLIGSMKLTFLPNGGDEDLRVILLSSPLYSDPAFLIRAEDTSILYGSGFSREVVSGNIYPTFPDMRIVASEKDRLAAWVLADDMIEVTLFRYILTTLDYVPVYASRQLIARIREELSGNPMLEKCRFFELFTPDISERKIGSIELRSIEGKDATYLGFRYNETILVDERRELHMKASKSYKVENFIALSLSESSCMITPSGGLSQSLLSGEIVSLRPKKIEKHSLRFTFDTFYVDKESIGVVAGYTLKDRKELGENGVLTFVLEEDRVKRAIIAHIYIDSRGFVHSHEMMPIHKEVLKGIRATYEKSVLSNPRMERAELVQIMRREITKYCYLLTGRTPVVLPIILER